MKKNSQNSSNTNFKYSITCGDVHAFFFKLYQNTIPHAENSCIPVKSLWQNKPHEARCSVCLKKQLDKTGERGSIKYVHNYVEQKVSDSVTSSELDAKAVYS